MAESIPNFYRLAHNSITRLILSSSYKNNVEQIPKESTDRTGDNKEAEDGNIDALCYVLLLITVYEGFKVVGFHTSILSLVFSRKNFIRLSIAFFGSKSTSSEINSAHFLKILVE